MRRFLTILFAAALALAPLQSLDAAKLYNLVRVATATTGTGTVTLGAASTGYLTFAEAGVQNGDQVSCVFRDGNDVEMGLCTYTSAGTTLARDAVTISKIGGTVGTAKINLSGNAIVTIAARAEDFPPVDASYIVGAAHGQLSAERVVTDTATVTWDLATAGQAKANAAASAMPRGHIWGLKLSNNGTDANNDIDVAAGEARNVDNNADMVLATAITKQLDAAWAVGTNQGCMDTGAEAASTWYAIFLIKRSDTGVVDVLCSLSATAPTMPTNYTPKRRIGWIRNNASSNILAFTHTDDEFILATPINDVAATPTTTATLVTLTVPPSTIANFRATIASVNGEANVLFYGPGESAPAPSLGTGLLSLSTSSGGDVTSRGAGHFQLSVSSSSQITHDASSTGGSPSFDISTYGWIDRRGRLM